MRAIRDASEHEMVGAFLAAEFDSSRHGQAVRSALANFQLSEEIITKPNLANAVENAQRDSVLSAYRGWHANKYLFFNWPSNLTWSLVAISRDDLDDCRYLKHEHWDSLSHGTRRVKVGANQVKGGDQRIPPEIPVAAIKDMAKEIRAGLEIPPLISVGLADSPRIVVVEGHARITAYALANVDHEIKVLHGTGSTGSLASWPWYPPVGEEE